MDTLKASSAFRNGTLGGDLLSRFTVVYNFSNETIAIKKNASFKKGFYYNLSGLTISAQGPRLNKFIITDVRKKSASARAGLLIGDEIIEINSLPATEIKLEEINGMLNKKAGKKINLGIKRGSEIMKVKIILEKSA
jgi:C-terminal processing protease CtpA/Prc